MIVGNELQCLGFSEAYVGFGTSCHFLEFFAEPLLPSWLTLLVIDDCGPHSWLSMSYSSAFTQHLVLVGHIHDAERYFRPGSD